MSQILIRSVWVTESYLSYLIELCILLLESVLFIVYKLYFSKKGEKPTNNDQLVSLTDLSTKILAMTLSSMKSYLPLALHGIYC